MMILPLSRRFAAASVGFGTGRVDRTAPYCRKMGAAMYTLHYSPDTASLAVRIVLAELAVPHQSQLIDREAGALDSLAYRALHPLGLIPAMETPDGPMFETAAMLLYLSDRHPGLAPAPDSPERAAFLKWLFFTSTNVHPCLLQLFYPDRVAGDALSDAVMAHARARMQTYLGALNDMVAQDAPNWMSQGKPGLMGYYVGMLMRWLATYGAGHPSYFRSAEFPALHAVLAAHEVRAAALAIAADENLGPTLFTNPAY